jgi:hypothetical protein
LIRYGIVAMNPKNLWLAAILATGAFAHPGESEEVKRAEAQARADYLATLKHTNLAHCAGKLGSKAVIKRTIERRRQLAEQLVKRSVVHKLSLFSLIGFQIWKSAKVKVSFLTRSWKRTTGPSSISATASRQQTGPYLDKTSLSSCTRIRLKAHTVRISTCEMLQLTLVGVEGEFIRQNVIEKEKGVVLHLDIQVVDINTCTPIPKAAVEIWGANATGVYSGVVGFMNGNTRDTSNQQNKALRGIQITDKEGAVQFDTILPGGYMGRTAHIHGLFYSAFAIAVLTMQS